MLCILFAFVLVLILFSCICVFHFSEFWLWDFCNISFKFLFLSFQIFRTPDGMLSSEQGVYVAESVAAKNTKQAKGRFRMYEDQDDMVILDLLLSFLSVFFPLFLLCFLCSSPLVVLK